eukprot:SAG11_NODE_12706_length_689_cov_1.230508_2_plen_80_part_01
MDCVVPQATKDAEKVGTFSKNMVLEALETVTAPNGKLRVRFKGGWTSESIGSERILKEIKFVDSKHKHDADAESGEKITP